MKTNYVPWISVLLQAYSSEESFHNDKSMSWCMLEQYTSGKLKGKNKIQ